MKKLQFNIKGQRPKAKGRFTTEAVPRQKEIKVLNSVKPEPNHVLEKATREPYSTSRSRECSLGA
ncbi:unnamed protein product [Rhodiola kirilowii]